MTYISPMWYVSLIVFAIFVIQISLSIYVYTNAKKYQMNPWLWAIIAFIIPNFMGIIVYLLVRSQAKESVVCRSCGNQISKGAHFCAHCGADLSLHCSTCFYSIDKDWKFCPNCSQSLEGER